MIYIGFISRKSGKYSWGAACGHSRCLRKNLTNTDEKLIHETGQCYFPRLCLSCKQILLTMNAWKSKCQKPSSKSLSVISDLWLKEMMAISKMADLQKKRAQNKYNILLDGYLWSRRKYISLQQPSDSQICFSCCLKLRVFRRSSKKQVEIDHYWS